MWVLLPDLKSFIKLDEKKKENLNERTQKNEEEIWRGQRHARHFHTVVSVCYVTSVENRKRSSQAVLAHICAPPDAWGRTTFTDEQNNWLEYRLLSYMQSLQRTCCMWNFNILIMVHSLSFHMGCFSIVWSCLLCTMSWFPFFFLVFSILAEEIWQSEKKGMFGNSPLVDVCRFLPHVTFVTRHMKIARSKAMLKRC